MQKVAFWTLWVIVAFFAINLVLISASYFSFKTDFQFLNHKQEFLSNKIWLATFYVHLAFGIVCVIAGGLLFFKKIIHFRSGLHKKVGKLYFISILFFSGPTGFYLSFFAEGGPVATVGFIMMSLFWMLISYKALERILKKDYTGHYKWVIRSYCFTLSGVTLRLMTPFGVQVLGLGEETNFILTAYAPWIFNICLGELIILFNRQQIHQIHSFILKK